MVVRALRGEILPGTLVVFVAYLRNIYLAVEKFSDLFLDLAKSSVSGERLLDLVENDLVMQDEPHAVPAPPSRAGSPSKTSALPTKRARRFYSGSILSLSPVKPWRW